MSTEHLKKLVEALKGTNWSSWQTTASFSKELDEAEASLAKERVRDASDDLLGAAKLVLAWYEAENDHSKVPDFYERMAMCRASENAIRAAIAKAEGGAA